MRFPVEVRDERKSLLWWWMRISAGVWRTGWTPVGGRFAETVMQAQ